MNWTPQTGHPHQTLQGTGPSQFRNCVQGAVFIGKTILRHDWGGGSVTLCDPAQCSCPCRSRGDGGGVMLLFSCFFGCPDVLAVLVVLVVLGRQNAGQGTCDGTGQGRATISLCAQLEICLWGSLSVGL